MKKSLLLSALAVAAVMPAMAATDGFTYPAKNGLTMTNLWIASMGQTPSAWEALPFGQGVVASGQDRARTACIANVDGQDVVVVGFSQTPAGGDVNAANLVLLDFKTGELIRQIQCTENGEPITGLLCANQVGCDQFGHVWFAGYVGNLYNPATQTYTPINIYMVDDFETGACTKVASLTLDESVADLITDGATRTDHYDIVGDITRKEANCNVMTPISGGSGASVWVCSWACEQGSDEWTGGLDGSDIIEVDATYPKGQTDWGTAPCVRIVVDDDYSNNLYYIDGNTTCPTLYNPSGAIVGSFESEVGLAPNPSPNGVGEFTLGGKLYMAYVLGQYDKAPWTACRLVELGEGGDFEGMTPYWVFPAKDGEYDVETATPSTVGMGDVKDGIRYQAVMAKTYTDANGKEAAYILDFKCANGVGVYVVAQEGYEEDGVADALIDNSNAPVEYFNLQGVRVDNPAAGQLIIRRQGTEATKMLVK